MFAAIPQTPHDASYENPLVFLHVPKTAGTTLWLILMRQYSPQAVLRVDHPCTDFVPSAPMPGPHHILLGHLPYGVHGFRQPPTYVTLLREPLERTLSHYGHLARSTAVSLPLDEYLNQECLHLDNLQTRMLAGPEADSLPFGKCDRDVFELAKCNLNDGIAVAGLTERFDEMLLLLQSRFGWRLPCYVHENIGANRVSRDDLSREQLKRIWELTHWDRQLYALAAARLDAQVALEGKSFPDRLRQLRIANARYRQIKRFAASGPLHTLKSLLALNKQMGLESAVRTVLSFTHVPAFRPAPTCQDARRS